MCVRMSGSSVLEVISALTLIISIKKCFVFPGIYLF